MARTDRKGDGWRPYQTLMLPVLRIAAERRCLIPVTEFAEAEGERGVKTRTWFTLPDQEVFAVAGLWRNTPEWGLAYTMVMTEACIYVADVHDRMPVILRREDWSDWLDGAPNAANLLCRPYPDLVVNRTDQPWVQRVRQSAEMSERASLAQAGQHRGGKRLYDQSCEDF